MTYLDTSRNAVIHTKTRLVVLMFPFHGDISSAPVARRRTPSPEQEVIWTKRAAASAVHRWWLKRGACVRYVGSASRGFCAQAAHWDNEGGESAWK